VQAVLLDIEGTTVPLRFVHDTLFPLAREGCKSFLREHHSDPEIASALIALALESRSDARSGAPRVPSRGKAGFLDQALAYYFWLMDRDRKSTPLKIIQGRIWQQAFESGTIRSPVFEDVPAALRRWKNEGRTVAIYSSGSVLAQKLVFRYSEVGDLSLFMSYYFDTTIGGKKEPGSYAFIARQLGVAAEQIVFLSDVPEELEAARTSGIEPRLCLRPGNAPVSDPLLWTSVRSFAEV